MRVAQDEAERELIWKTRKAAFAAMGRIVAELLRAGLGDPAHPALEVLRRIEELSAEHELRVANVFHAGDGNLHPLVLLRRRQPGRGRARRGAGRADREGVRGRGRLDHRRARRGRRQEALHAEEFSEPDLAAFQKLRCAFDPQGLANPGKVMPTPRLCGEVPGPLPPASARGGRHRGALLMAVARCAARRPRATRRPRRCCATAPRRAAPCGSRAAARRVGWGGPLEREPDVELSTAALDRDRRAQRGRPHRGAPGGRAAGARRSERSRRPARCSRSTRRRPRRRDDRRRRGERRLGPAAPPLRRGARPGAGRGGRAARRQRRARGRQGDQERGGLRPRQAVRGLVRHARRDRRGGGAAAPAAPDRERRRRRATTRSGSRPRRAALAHCAARGAGARHRLARAARAACSRASPGGGGAPRRPRRRRLEEAGSRRRCSSDDARAWEAAARGAARRPRGARVAVQTRLAAVLRAAERRAAASVVGRAALGSAGSACRPTRGRTAVEQLRARARARALRGARRARGGARPSSTRGAIADGPRAPADAPHGRSASTRMACVTRAFVGGCAWRRAPSTTSARRRPS